MRFQRPDGPPLEVEVDDVIIAGWAGRDTEAVAHHIAELEAIGVAPPSKTPLFYRVGASLLTTAPRVQVVGAVDVGVGGA